MPRQQPEENADINRFPDIMHTDDMSTCPGSQHGCRQLPEAGIRHPGLTLPHKDFLDIPANTGRSGS